MNNIADGSEQYRIALQTATVCAQHNGHTLAAY
jgi:hypothetical protein